ncbi:hypothetical protein LJE86_14335 [bacterium BMS3Abin03]|nr:hypothetical protein [bacterium BMS3Abin03]
MNTLTRLLRIVVLILAVISMTMGILKFVSVNDTLWLFVGVGFIWLLILLQIVEKNMPEEILR